jgi:competence protein ComEC
VKQPLDLYNAGFQLSFGTVLGLKILGNRVFTAMGGGLTADEEALQRAGGSLGWRPRVRRALVASVSAGLVAWVVSMPLIAFHFEQLNPWAVIASLLLAIPVFLALMGGFFKIALTLLIPWGAGWWATLATLPVAGMRHVLDWLAHLPGSDVPLPSHSISFVVVYYALLCIPLIPAAKPALRRSLRLAPALAVILLAILPLSGGAVRLPDGSLRVTMLAIGAGQCAVVELPDGRAILIDAGSATLTEPVRKCIAPFLRTCGRGSIDEIWLSHGDYDHVSAAAELIRTYGVPRVIVSDAFESHSGGGTDETLLETIRNRHVALEHVHAGDRASLGKDVSLEVLWPAGDDPSLTSNNAGLVLKLTYARRTILFPADIQEPAQLPLVKHPEQLRCDVLIAPHHGSSEATTAAFVAAADPLYVVSSNDRTLTQKQRLFEKIVAKRQLFRTNVCGAVSITIGRNGGIDVTPFVPAPASGPPDAVAR